MAVIVVRLHCQFFDTCIELSNISDSSRQVVLGRKDFPCLKEELLISRQQFKIDVTDFVSITSVPPPPLTQHPRSLDLDLTQTNYALV
jgi:hypothetical protein